MTCLVVMGDWCIGWHTIRTAAVVLVIFAGLIIALGQATGVLGGDREM